MVINYLKKAKKTAAAPLKAKRPKLDYKEKKKIEKQYEEEIKEVLGGAKDKAKAVEIKKPEPAAVQESVAATPLNQNFEKIRQAVLEELKLANMRETEPSLNQSEQAPEDKELKSKKEKICALLDGGLKFLKKIFYHHSKAGKADEAKLRPKQIEAKSSLAKDGLKKAAKSHELWPFLLTIVFTILFLVIIASAGIYLGGWDKPLVQQLAKIIPYPALYIDGEFISANSFLEDTAALKKYLERQGLPFTESQLKKQIMESLIEKGVIKKLAQKKGISVSEAEAQKQLEFIFISSESKTELENLIQNLYGWNLDKYTEKIIKPLLLAQKIEEDFYSSAESSRAKEQLENYYKQLAEKPDDFSQIAEEVNEDNTKYIGGDLGWFSLGDMAPEFELVLLNLEEGEISQVFKTRFGWHLVKLEEKLVDDSGQVSFHASHIFLKHQSFADYLSEQIKKARVVTLIKI